MMYPALPGSTKGHHPHRDAWTSEGTPREWAHHFRLGDAVWRVRAGVTIPAGITVGPYPSEMLLGTNTADNPKGDKYIEVKVEDKTLMACPDVNTPRHWLLHMTPARDRHEQNVEAIRDARGMIAFRIIKEIQNGDELFVWYSTELAMECNIPILTPANIRGGQEYTCTSCDVSFHYPNTLKAHIRFHCARNTMTSSLDQHNSLQAGNLLTTYQQELSKYLSYLWTLRTIASTTGMCMTSIPPGPSPDPRYSAKSVFSPFNAPLSGWADNISPTVSPITSPFPPERTLGEQRSNTGGAVTDTKNRFTTDHTRKTSPLTSYPIKTPLPNNLASVLKSNYGRRLRPGPEEIPRNLGLRPDELSRYLGIRSDNVSLPQHPLSFAPDMLCASMTSPERIQSHRHHSRSGIGCHDDIRQHENMSPGSDGNTSPRLPVGHINFPMPSDTAGEPIDLLPKSMYTSKAYKGHLCIYCGNLYSRKYGLKIHLRTHTGYKPLKCKVCLRAFGDPSNLNKHIRLHAEGDTPYRCEYCGKVLVRRRDLERHIKSRHPNESTPVTSYPDDQSEALADTDNSFLDVDDDDDMIDECNSSCQDIEVI